MRIHCGHTRVHCSACSRETRIRTTSFASSGVQPTLLLPLLLLLLSLLEAQDALPLTSSPAYVHPSLSSASLLYVTWIPQNASFSL